MIDEKKLIEDLQKCFVNNSIHKNDLAEAIAKQPKVGEWIPCSERLPERDRPFQTGGYLVTAQFVKDGKTGKEFTSQASFDYENKRWLVRDCEVLAWCELPEPYNADMRGGKNE